MSELLHNGCRAKKGLAILINRFFQVEMPRHSDVAELAALVE